MSTRTMLGLVVVAVGLLFLGDNFGVVRAHSIFAYWPLVVLGFGVVKLTQKDCGKSGQIVGLVLTLAGLGLTAYTFYRGPVPIDVAWSLGFIVFGVSLLTRHLDWPKGSEQAGTIGGPSPGGGPDDTVSGVAFWSGFKRRITSPAFRRADLTAMMGGVDLDLRPATAAPNGAVIDVFAMWGGIVIRVPPDWAVSNKVMAVMGGVDDRSSGVQDARNRLTVRGFVLMGGVEIKT